MKIVNQMSFSNNRQLSFTKNRLVVPYFRLIYIINGFPKYAYNERILKIILIFNSKDYEPERFSFYDFNCQWQCLNTEQVMKNITNVISLRSTEMTRRIKKLLNMYFATKLYFKYFEIETKIKP